MRELALNILDIAANSVKAGAKRIAINVSVLSADNSLIISVDDDGCGMSAEMLKSVTDPFTTSRKTRKVGMGIPLFKCAAESAGGGLEITSEQGVGTLVKASFLLNHIDRMPLGDLPETIIGLINMSPKTELCLCYSVNGREFNFNTNEAIAFLDGVPIESPEVLQFLKAMLEENISDVNGGLLI